MAKLTIVCLILVVLVVESYCQVRFILPTYRPPPQPSKPIIRYARDSSGQEPLWLYKGDDVIHPLTPHDHPVLPSLIDDMRLGPTRHARSLGTPGRGRVGSNDTGNRGQDTGATHPGYNRRNARSIPSRTWPDFVTTPPFNPKPWPQLPRENPRIPIYV